MINRKPIHVDIPLGDESITIRSGYIATLTESSVEVTQGETKIVVTVAHAKLADKKDFFPLSVHYVEKHYCTAKIPGSFTRREARPSDREVLTSRLIDRSVRPLFPKAFMDEVQIICTVHSLNPEHQPDILSIIGASAALNLSSLPFTDLVTAIRVREEDGELTSKSAMSTPSKLDLVVAGISDSVMMVEAQSDEVPEDKMCQAFEFALNTMKKTADVLAPWIAEHKKEKLVVEAFDLKPLTSVIASKSSKSLQEALHISTKNDRDQAISIVKQQMMETLTADDKLAEHAAYFAEAVQSVVRSEMRQMILKENRRVDGRDTETVRPINIDTEFFKAGAGPHGGVVFTRGETQAIATTTLGNDRDAQLLDLVIGESKQRFMLHYNFPPYCVGEAGMLATKRREIGHGALAQKALKAMLPSDEVFPYVIRIVSEITESNGSSSMATVCGGSLSLMLAGVPIKKPVAGIALGLIKEGKQCAVLTDILGMEDFLGDMDFKVAGTDSGINALQMDIKIKGISTDVLTQALKQAHKGRIHILGIMNEAVPKTLDIAQHAPQMKTFAINPAKIKDVIGKGGAVIKGICEKFDVTVDITDDGQVKIFGLSLESIDEAVQHITTITKDIEVGDTYDGTIVKIMDFGAFVNLKPGKDGFLHISEIKDSRVENIHDEIENGQKVTVKVVQIDQQNRIKLSLKDVKQAN